MSGTGVKVSGLDKITAGFDRAADVLRDEPKIRDAQHAALRPVAELMYEKAPKRTGAMANDIRVGDEPSGDGIVRSAVGFGHGKHGQGYKARFNEFGTSEMPAHPFMRPAYDGTGGAEGAGARVTQALLPDILKALRS